MNSSVGLCKFLLVVLFVPMAHGFWMDLPWTGPKCISEELHSNVLVLADFYTFLGETHEFDNNTLIIPSVSIKVVSPHGNVVYQNGKATHGKIGFTSTEAGNYVTCIELVGDLHKGKKVSFGLEWNIGVAAKDWDSIARKEKIQGLELELKKLEEYVGVIHKSLIDMMDKEWDMSKMSESTNANVAWYSIISLCICIVVALLQVYVLRRYFRTKKLI